MYWHLIIPWCYFLSVARINSSSIFGRRVLFLAAKTGTPFHFFLLKVEWGAIFGPFRFWYDTPNCRGRADTLKLTKQAI